MKVIKLFVMIFVFSLAACGKGSGNEYLGMWKDVSSEDKLKIEKNGENFIVTSYTKLVFGLDPNEISENKMAATYKNEGLELSGTLGMATFVIDQKTGHLIGAGSEYQKVN